MADDWWLIASEARDRRNIRELQDNLEAVSASAAAQRRALRSELANVKGSIETRLNRLAASFDAFVELTELRERLTMYDIELTTRRRVNRLLDGLAKGAADPPPLDLPDCPGYWLPAAGEALSALVRGDTAVAERAAAEAEEIDAERTVVFLTLALMLADRYDLAARWLPRALPELAERIPAVARRLWVECAHGRFGDTGRELLAQRLTEHITGLSPELTAQGERTWRAKAAVVADRSSAPRLPSVLSGNKELARPLAAADGLQRLAEHVTKLTDVEAVPPEQADLVAPLARLVAEGSPDERPGLARYRELRAVLEGTVNTDGPQDEETAGLLLGDAFGTDPLLGRPALLAGTGWVIAYADGLLAETARELPLEITATTYRTKVKVGLHGADLTDTYAAIDREKDERLGRGLIRFIRTHTPLRKSIDEWAVEQRAQSERTAQGMVAGWAEFNTTYAEAAGRAREAHGRILEQLGKVS